MLRYVVLAAVLSAQPLPAAKVTVDDGAHGVSITNVDTDKLPFIHIHRDGSVEINGAGTTTAQHPKE